MKISYKWLQQYVDQLPEPEELSRLLTDSGLEVEGLEVVESVKGGLKGVVIGEVVSCEPHPDSDHLSLTKINVGAEELLPIVCGAPNIAAGLLVPVATVGTVLYDGDSSFKIKKSKIRGEVSLGMVCSESELNIGVSHEGIMELKPDAIPGTSAKSYFKIEDDYLFEIGLTPNRTDGTSHIGVCRDIVALLRQHKNRPEAAIKMPDISSFSTENHDLPITIEVKDSYACPRYTGLTIKGVTVKESPEWLKNFLMVIGLRPINNIVDITNFVLWEIGQPLHAFDYNKIAGKKIVVQKLAENTPFTTLDDIDRKLSAEDLMICSADEGLCIAGVFGGTVSGVTEQTTDIFLESAYFDAATIRKTARRHTLQTDASFRYERGADPNINVWAIKRAALLIKELAGGTISSDIIDVYPTPIAEAKIDLDLNYLARLIGKMIPVQTVKNILLSLDFAIVSEDETSLQLLVPHYRVDVTRPADVVEEVLRIYGFNNIELPDAVHSSLSYMANPNPVKVGNSVADMLSSKGFTEFMNNSLVKSTFFEGFEDFSSDRFVKILNPLSSDLNIMRPSLIFGGLESVAYNLKRQEKSVMAYEFGRIYRRNIETDEYEILKRYSEENHLGLFISGNSAHESWRQKVEAVDFFTLKQAVHAVLNRLGINMRKMKSAEANLSFIQEGLSYSNHTGVLVEFGLLTKNIVSQFDISQPVYFADFNWDNILKSLSKRDVSFTEVSKFPEVRRDLSLLLDRSVKFSEIEAVAYKSESKLLKNVSLFDIYEGDKLGANKKSYAISFMLQDSRDTLKEKQIEKIMEKLTRAITTQFSATLR